MTNSPTLCQQHGVMMNINGHGILIIGQPGIGKSSFALELLHHHHQFIADDIVDCERIMDSVQTSSPDILKGYLHSRELGVIDVAQQFGESAILKQSKLDYVIELSTNITKKNAIETAQQHYSVCDITYPMLQLSVHNPASCYHRLLTWLAMQDYPDAAKKLIERQQQALVNEHS